MDFGFWVLDFGFWVLGFGCWVLGVGFWILCFGFWILGFGFWVLGFGFWVLGFGFWILGFGVWGTLEAPRGELGGPLRPLHACGESFLKGLEGGGGRCPEPLEAPGSPPVADSKNGKQLDKSGVQAVKILVDARKRRANV